MMKNTHNGMKTDQSTKESNIKGNIGINTLRFVKDGTIILFMNVLDIIEDIFTIIDLIGVCLLYFSFHIDVTIVTKLV